MNRFSIIAMKSIRRIKTRVQSWYRQTAFLSGLEYYEEPIRVGGGVNLWNHHVSIGEFTNIYPNVTLWGPGKISIGRHVEVGIGSVIYSSQEISIGDNSLLAAYCYIIDSNHGMAADKLIREQTSTVKGSVIIGNDVWLGAGVRVLSGVHIGDGAVIGAQALVNADIPANAIAVGVPAKVIGYRK